jgi:excisionase family DNA binding protein
MPQFLSLPELAARLNVSTSTLRRMVKRGELPAVRVGSQLRFNPETVLTVINETRGAVHA